MTLASVYISYAADKMAMFKSEEYNDDGKMPGAHQLVLRGGGYAGGMQLVPLKFYPHREEMSVKSLEELLRGKAGNLEERRWGGYV